MGQLDTYDLDEPGPAPPPPPPRSWKARQPGLRALWWPALILLIVVAVAAFAVDQRGRGQEFDALLDQVEQGQSAVVYSDARVQAIVKYTSPQLLSAQAPPRVRASLRGIVQQAAAGRLKPMQARRDAVANLSAARWHTDQRRARDAYLAYLDERIAFLRAVSVDLRALYRPQPDSERLLDEARAALLAVSPGGSERARIRGLLP